MGRQPATPCYFLSSVLVEASRSPAPCKVNALAPIPAEGAPASGSHSILDGLFLLHLLYATPATGCGAFLRCARACSTGFHPVYLLESPGQLMALAARITFIVLQVLAFDRHMPPS